MNKLIFYFINFIFKGDIIGVSICSSNRVDIILHCILQKDLAWSNVHSQIVITKKIVLKKCHPMPNSSQIEVIKNKHYANRCNL